MLNTLAAPARKVRSRVGAGEHLTPGAHASALLDSLGLRHAQLPVDDRRDAAGLWADSGAMWLTGHAGGECRHSPAPLAACAQGAWLALAALAPRQFDPSFDAHRLMGERAACAGLERRGRMSAGGACRLLRSRDGWIALNLPREQDHELLPAWLGRPLDGPEDLAAAVGTRATRGLVARARLLGLAVAPLREPPRARQAWYHATTIVARAVPPGPARRPLVLDLGALWAAPLCAQLLRQAGARVIKVEGSSRPDGARAGPRAFFDLLNAGKESVALDLHCDAGREQLRRLLLHADIVVESSRPRALEQMGLHAARFLADRPGMTWLGLSGYGRRAPNRDWIAYGDDAGVAAGLSWQVGGTGHDPVFCGDAIADPVTGIHAALLALADWQAGGGRLVDISLHGVMRHIAALGHGAPPPAPGTVARAPSARPSAATAAALGADTQDILREFARRGV